MTGSVSRAARVTASIGIAAVVGANVWIRLAAAGRIRTPAEAPTTAVAIVLGAQVRDGQPMSFLAGRLDTAVQLFHEGRVGVVLVSGDGNGSSGDEIAAMTEYLVGKGIPHERIVGDPLGLRTYDTCARAVHTFGIERALVVSQAFHVPRIVALSRRVGLNAVGVNSECNCRATSLARNRGREWLLARPRAVVDILLRHGPTVVSEPDDAIEKALAALG
ncbi:SanA/YdcF family protein [Antrihabitans spumae]|uniref:Vancomycin high temperature exclusion protein n=1 Tax=Antrihabitans spumae TaxID=3373370 RepID=A0ABW7KGZ2_9NOCA